MVNGILAAVSVLCIVAIIGIVIVGFTLKRMASKVRRTEKAIESIQHNYVNKEEFLRTIAEMNRKFDRMDDKLDKLLMTLSANKGGNRIG